MGVTVRQAFAGPFVFIALGIARAAALSLPFRTYAPIFGEVCDDHATAPPSAIPAAREPSREGRRARHIGRTIESVARFTPWNSNCLAQTLVAAVCLRAARISFSVHFGVSPSEKADQPIEAHSWVMAGAYPVTGYAQSVGMTRLQTFRLERS
ncbi:MAG: lasso peptide biosynthesis B2 protein [Pseudomonadota bacterium]